MSRQRDGDLLLAAIVVAGAESGKVRPVSPTALDEMLSSFGVSRVEVDAYRRLNEESVMAALGRLPIPLALQIAPAGEQEFTMADFGGFAGFKATLELYVQMGRRDLVLHDAIYYRARSKDPELLDAIEVLLSTLL